MAKSNYTIQEVKERIDIFSEFNYIRSAYEYYKELKDYLAGSGLKQSDPKLYGEYYRYLIRLKFLSLEFFDDWKEVEELIKNHFEEIYKIEFYDLWNKIKIKILSVPDLKKRDEIKQKLKKVLLDCNRVIIDKSKHKKGFPATVSQWLKDFTANLGIGKIDNLKRVQYLTNSENIKKLEESDKHKLKILFDLYGKLGLSSNSPEGLEDDIPMVINEKNIIYTGGQAEEISPKVMEMIKSIKMGDEEESESSTDLQKLVSKYPEGSLERKAVEEEIDKVKSKK